MNNVNNMYYQNYSNVNDMVDIQKEMMVQQDLTNKEEGFRRGIRMNKEKDFFEISNDGKELKKSNIIPVVNDNKSNLQNGIIYVESPFQKDEYFDITEFNQKSQDKWREIIRELSSKRLPIL